MTRLTKEEIDYIKTATHIKALEFENISDEHRGHLFENKVIQINSGVFADTQESLTLYRCFPHIEGALNVLAFDSLMDLGWRNRKIRSDLREVNEESKLVSTKGLQVIGCELSSDLSMPKFRFKEAVWVDNTIYTCRFHMSVFEDCEIKELSVVGSWELKACQVLNTSINLYKPSQRSLENPYARGRMEFLDSYLENNKISLYLRMSLKEFKCISSEIKGCTITLSDPYVGDSQAEDFDLAFTDSTLAESSINLNSLLSLKRLRLNVDASDLDVVTYGPIALTIKSLAERDRGAYRFEDSHLKFLNLDHSDDDRQSINIFNVAFVNCELVWEYRSVEIENLFMFANSQIEDCSFEDCTITQLPSLIWMSRTKFLRCELRDIDLQGERPSLEFLDCTFNRCYVSDRRFEAMGGKYIGNKAKVEGEILKFRQLQNFDSRESEFEDCVFEDCDLTNLDFTDSHFVNCKFVKCLLYSTRFAQVYFKNCEFIECKMFKAAFPSARLVSTHFNSNILSDNRFDSSSFKNVRFEGINHIYGKRSFDLLKAKPASEILFDSSTSLWLIDPTCDECGEREIPPIEHSKAIKKADRAICWSCEREAEYFDDSYDDDSWD